MSGFLLGNDYPPYPPYELRFITSSISSLWFHSIYMASAVDDVLSALAEGLHHASTTLHRIMVLLEAKAACECLVATRL